MGREKQEARANPSLKETRCTELSYRLTVPKGTFDSVALAKRAGKVERSGNWTSIRRKSSDNEYHIHVYWRDETDEDDAEASKSKLQVDVHLWEPEWIEENREPTADIFFAWVGDFFNVARLTSHVHAEFKFPSKKWQSKIMALPIEVPYAGKTASITGFSVMLHSEPEGIGQIWIDTGNENLSLELYGDRLMEFKSFDLRDDIGALLSVARSVIEEKKL